MGVVDHQVLEVVPQETPQKSLGQKEGVPRQEVKLVHLAQCGIRPLVRVPRSVVCCDGESGNDWMRGGGPEY